MREEIFALDSFLPGKLAMILLKNNDNISSTAAVDILRRLSTLDTDYSVVGCGLEH